MVENTEAMKKRIFFLCLIGLASVSIQSTAYASFLGGLGKAVFAPLEIPKAMLQQGPISGALNGTVNAVSGIASGLGQMAQGATSGAVSAAQTAAPYAKYAWIPLVL